MNNDTFLETIGKQVDGVSLALLEKKNLNLQRVFLKAGLVDESLSLTHLGRLLFVEPNSKTAYFTFISGQKQGLPSEAKTFSGSPYSAWSSLLNDVVRTIPLYEDRASLSRIERPEISESVLRSALAYSISRSFILKNPITIEHHERTSSIVIRFLVSHPREETMIGVVRCLAFLKEVGWHPRQDVSEQERKNKLRMSKTSDFITLSLFYETRKSDFDYGERSGSRKESESGMKALRLAVINGRITRRALVADTGMSLRQASYVLMGLTKNGYLVRNGKKESPSAYYLLTKKGKILLASGE
ncbi:MAG: hypothetical protein LKG11_03815 [Bacilli bacterium]|jgi:predicted HTH transcriptional regulator|nr:hypothetical protein [Bacilli bacterium]